jgi:hypothetical protein
MIRRSLSVMGWGRRRRRCRRVICLVNAACQLKFGNQSRLCHSQFVHFPKPFQHKKWHTSFPVNESEAKSWSLTRSSSKGVSVRHPRFPEEFPALREPGISVHLNHDPLRRGSDVSSVRMAVVLSLPEERWRSDGQMQSKDQEIIELVAHPKYQTPSLINFFMLSSTPPPTVVCCESSLASHPFRELFALKYGHTIYFHLNKNWSEVSLRIESRVTCLEWDHLTDRLFVGTAEKGYQPQRLCPSHLTL